jgi:hypothetical protein
MVATTRTETDRRDSDLAAELTDFVLEGLARAGVRGDSVALELAAWQALDEALSRESRWQRWTRLGGGSPAESVLAHVVHRATLAVAAAFAPRRHLADLEWRLRPWLAGLRVSPRQRGLLAERLARTDRDWGRVAGTSGIVRALRVRALN